MTPEINHCAVCGCELLPGEGDVCARDLPESERRLLAAQREMPSAWVMHTPGAAHPWAARPAPVPAHTAADALGETRELATFSARFVGLLIDIASWWTAVLFLSASSPVLGGVLILTTPVVLWTFNAKGWSPGRGLMGLRTVNDRGEAPGIGAGLVRTLAALLSLAFVGIGYLWAAWDEEHQTWHDKIAGTYVVSVVTHDLPGGSPPHVV